MLFFFFFFNDTATTEIYTLSLHDALPICAVTHTDAEREAPARRLGERERGLGHRDRMARIDRDDAHAEAEARGGRPVRGEDEERVATETVGDPDALVAERLGATGELHGSGEVAPGCQVGGAPHPLTPSSRAASLTVGYFLPSRVTMVSSRGGSTPK